jgi:hypothetical protein
MVSGRLLKSIVRVTSCSLIRRWNERGFRLNPALEFSDLVGGVGAAGNLHLGRDALGRGHELKAGAEGQ